MQGNMIHDWCRIGGELHLGSGKLYTRIADDGKSEILFIEF